MFSPVSDAHNLFSIQKLRIPSPPSSKGGWGAFYIFKSEKALKEYIASDIWQKVVPEKYGCKPTWAIVEVGFIISKKTITAKENSWISD